MSTRQWALIAIVFATPLAAQWLDYPTQGVPRTRDGKPNLKASAPRAANGKPDFSGIWSLEAPGCSSAGCDDYVAGQEFINLGAKLPGGLPYLPWASELVQKRSVNLGKDDPVASCRPAGVVRMLTFPPPRKIIQMPGELVVLSERDVTFWQIFTDGRPLPKDPEPTFNGFSTGKWEGDTLVVQTVGVREGIWLDRNGSPLTADAKLVWRFRRPNFGRLEVELSVDDPKAYSRPWTVNLNQNIVLNTELLDYFCMDNEKDALHAVGK